MCFVTDSFHEIKSIFFSPHSDGWSDLYKHISKVTNIRPKIITTLRHPSDRLLSHIKHWGRKVKSLELILEHINSKHIDFDNCMYRHIFDIQPIRDDYNSEKKEQEITAINDIDFFDLITFP